MKNLVCLIPLFVASVLYNFFSARAEGADLKPPAERVPAEREARWSRAMAEAKALALTGKITPAENLLTTFNFTQPGTAEWYQQTAAQLTRLIYAIAIDGEEAVQRAVAERAIENLKMAERLAGTPIAVAQILQQTGHLQEHVLHDLVGAKETYRRAVVVNPGNGVARGALDRLDKADHELAAKHGPKG
jgi:hypothetical protein